MALTQLESLVLRGVQLGGDVETAVKRFDSNGVAGYAPAITSNLSPSYPDTDNPRERRFLMEAAALRAGRPGSQRSVPVRRSLARSARPSVLLGRTRHAGRVGCLGHCGSGSVQREPAVALAMPFALRTRQ